MVALLGGLIYLSGARNVAIAVLLGGMVVEGLLVMRMIRNIKCPICSAPLDRNPGTVSLDCPRCQIAWKTQK